LKQSACATLNCAALDPNAYAPAASDLLAWNVNAYDAYGNLTSAKRVRDFAGQVATPTALSNTGPILATSYDANGLNPATVARTGIKNAELTPTTQSATLTFDTLGRLKTGIDGDWYATQISYDSVDRIAQADDLADRPRRFGLCPNHQPQAVNPAAMLAPKSPPEPRLDPNRDPPQQHQRHVRPRQLKNLKPGMTT
jgi:hypothetical protein